MNNLNSKFPNEHRDLRQQYPSALSTVTGSTVSSQLRASGHNLVSNSKYSKSGSSANASVFETVFGFTISVFTGDITQAEADAIVTGEGISKESVGMVTRALFKLMPRVFEQERSKMFKEHGDRNGWLKEGQVFVTELNHNPFGLKYRCVIHAVIPYYRDLSWKEMMVVTYNKVCKKADSHSLQSVAIPLLGTGQGRGSTGESIQGLALGLMEYARERCQQATCSVKEVQLYILNDSLKADIVQDILKVFCKQEDGDGFGPAVNDKGYQGRNIKHKTYDTSCYTDEVQKGTEQMSLNDQDKSQVGGRRPNTRKSNFARNGATFTSIPDGKDGKHVTKILCTGLGKVHASLPHGRSVTETEFDNSENDKADQACAKIESDRVGPEAESVTEEKLTDAAEDTCPICMDKMTEPTTLSICKHVFCRNCIDTSFKMYKPVCPSCQTSYGKITGNCPEGRMFENVNPYQKLSGYEEYGTIIIKYSIPSGIQSSEHPNPGLPYHGTSRTAYLPDSPEGQKVLQLLKVAWDRHLTFTVGKSTTTGRDNVVTWNDIHHKTNPVGGEAYFGYPDKTYLTRVTEELASKGVTEADLDYFQ